MGLSVPRLAGDAIQVSGSNAGAAVAEGAQVRIQGPRARDFFKAFTKLGRDSAANTLPVFTFRFWVNRWARSSSFGAESTRTRPSCVDGGQSVYVFGSLEVTDRGCGDARRPPGATRVAKMKKERPCLLLPVR